MKDHGEIQEDPRAAAQSDAEHRHAHRQRTLKQARVVLSDWTTFDCRLRDLSDDGAHLVFKDSVLLPEEFRLHNVSDKSIAPVRLRWQRGLDVGVEFIGPSQKLTSQKLHD